MKEYCSSGSGLIMVVVELIKSLERGGDVSWSGRSRLRSRSVRRLAACRTNDFRRAAGRGRMRELQDGKCWRNMKESSFIFDCV